MSKYSPLFVCWLLFCLALFAGCSGAQSAKVSGLVTLDGEPLKSGGVTFHPASGEGAAGIGQIDASGKYTVRTGTTAGIVPGKYVITVVSTGPIPDAGPNQPAATPELLTPGKYGNVSTTDLSAEVKSGSNNVPLKLSKGP